MKVENRVVELIKYAILAQINEDHELDEWDKASLSKEAMVVFMVNICLR